MADADQEVTAWDEQGNPVKAPAAGAAATTAWDENGKPVSAPTEAGRLGVTPAPGTPPMKPQTETQFEKDRSGGGGV